MKILINTNNTIPSCNDILNADMVINVNGETFDIIKSRYGKLTKNNPVDVLDKVILNPNGKLTYDWK